MSTNVFPEVMIISDDEDEVVPPPSKCATPASNVNESAAPPAPLPSTTPSTTPVVDKDTPTFDANDTDSDCEITEISYLPSTNVPNSTSDSASQSSAPPVHLGSSLTIQLQTKEPETSGADSDCEITEVENVSTENSDKVSKAKSDEENTTNKPSSNDAEEKVSLEEQKTIETPSSTRNQIDEPPKSISEPVNADDDIEEIIVLSPEVTRKEIAPSLKEATKVEEPKPELLKPSDDDNTAFKHRHKRFKCCNVECNNVGTDFAIADSFDCGYFAVNEAKQQVPRVCKTCQNSVSQFQEVVMQMAKRGEPVVNAVRLLPKKDTVVLEDSDEEIDVEPEEKEVDPGDEMMAVDMQELEEIMKQVREVTHFDDQIALCEEETDKNHTKLASEIDDLENQFSTLETSVNALKKRLYDPWEPIFKEEPPLDIDDTQYYADYDGDSEYTNASVSPLPVATKSTVSSKTQRVVAMKRVTQITPAVASPSADNNDQLEVVDLGHVVCASASGPLPPSGPLFRPVPSMGAIVYAMKNNLFGEWLKAKIVDVSKSGSGEALYRVKFMKASAAVKVVSSRHIAYTGPPSVQLAVGTRIIAVFQNSEDETGKNKDTKDHYYAGIIAEQLKIINNHRYLIFFDDGFTQYVPHSKVCVVVGQSKNIWEDCHPECQDFTRTYVTQYPERPMVKLQVGQVVKTEWNTRWWLARVRKVDCSLVLVHFDADSRTEWIYRGSTRLGPLYTEMVKRTERQKKGERSRLHRSFTSARKVNAPYVEYTRGATQDQSDAASDDRRNAPRSVAKKSTVGRPQEVHVNPLPADRKENVGQVVVRDLTKLTGRRFLPHQCGPRCVGKEAFKEGKQRVLQNPMLIPLMQGWGRDLVTYKSRSQVVFYKTPCGRRLRNMWELTRFLRITKSNLGVDLFSFEALVRINTEFRVTHPLFSIKDISYDKENVVIPCVNTINHHEYPAYVEYTTKRSPTDGVRLNLDQEFLVCCDCNDGCQSSSKCQCRQLTLQEARVLNPQVDPEKVGYLYRRLVTPGCTAVYECNPRCKCKSTCLNRVVQHPMKVQLQLFKTEKRGWGIRTLNDLPAGTFLCIYAGQVLTEHEGNEEGKTYGDEYLAELDYIEVIENQKEGYESDVSDIENDDDDGDSEGAIIAERDDESREATRKGSDDEFTVDKTLTSKLGELAGSMTLRKRDEKKLENAEPSVAEPPAVQSRNVVAKKRTGEVRAPRGALGDSDYMKNVRWHFEKSEDIYVMDAKGIGNIGRYFNHSCDPNVFVQNVFVDTHDLRFPWVAFFTNQLCTAGTELCWNYNYEIDSLPGRRLDCYCETAICKGRLL